MRTAKAELDSDESRSKFEKLVEWFRKFDSCIVAFSAEVIAKKGATFYAPANGVARMVEAVRYDKKALIPVSTYLEGEYGVSGICIGVPVIIGAEGVEKIVQVPLSGKERESFDKGVATLKEAIASIQV